MTPIEKNVIVVDEQGKILESTYPKRAKGLVKKGRARFIAENKICLACPPNIFLEENKMENNIKQYNKEEQQRFFQKANVYIIKGNENIVFFVDPCDSVWQKTEITVMIDGRYYKKLTPTDDTNRAFVLKKVVNGIYSYIIKQFDSNDSILFEHEETFGYCYEANPGPLPGDIGTVNAC